MSSQSAFRPSENKAKEICDREEHFILPYVVREFSPWSFGFFAFRPAEGEQLAWQRVHLLATWKQSQQGRVPNIPFEDIPPPPRDLPSPLGLLKVLPAPNKIIV